jgi:hypothetical protein
VAEADVTILKQDREFRAELIEDGQPSEGVLHFLVELNHLVLHLQLFR